jgi:hypothetical protein
MSWTLVGKPQTMRVTRALAKKFAEMDKAPNDRPLSERRLAVYQVLLKKGLFRPVAWASAYCKETAGTYRVNGKHTSVMLSGLEQLPEFYCILEHYECETLGDVAQLYATFDSKMQSRSSSDINMSFAATVKELSGMHKSIINPVTAGIAYATFGEGTAAVQPAERAELLLDNTEFVVWFEGLLSNEPGWTIRKDVRHLSRMAGVAAMLKTWEKDEKDCKEFWESVRDETGATPDTPDRKLAKWLLTSKINRGSGMKSANLTTNKETYAKCIHAWNAWRKDESTALNYYSSKPVPSVE